jgi:hypothetical protein
MAQVMALALAGSNLAAVRQISSRTSCATSSDWAGSPHHFADQPVDGTRQPVVDRLECCLVAACDADEQQVQVMPRPVPRRAAKLF